MPLTDVCERDGSFALASAGSLRKVQLTGLPVDRRGERSVAVNWIVEKMVESPEPVARVATFRGVGRCVVTCLIELLSLMVTNLL